jgi:hypothetical protein
MRKVRFPVPAKSQPYCRDAEGRAITAITIKECTGPDEAYAAKRADSKGTKNTNEELIRFAIVSYECVNEKDEPVIVKCNEGTPFEAIDKWSTKARNYVAVGWRSLNAVTDEDADSFLEGAAPAE